MLGCNNLSNPSNSTRRSILISRHHLNHKLVVIYQNRQFNMNPSLQLEWVALQAGPITCPEIITMIVMMTMMKNFGKLSLARRTLVPPKPFKMKVSSFSSMHLGSPWITLASSASDFWRCHISVCIPSFGFGN